MTRIPTLISLFSALLLVACPATSKDSGSSPADADNDGYAADVDCDDSNAEINPGATEICNTLDDDCDALVDEPDAADAPVWYIDRDLDGQGDASGPLRACDTPEGYVANASDCLDYSAQAFQGADEVCDDLDNDCDGVVDEADSADAPLWFADTDSDGYGNAEDTIAGCLRPAGYVAEHGDCDDHSAEIHPGAAELCNRLDDDCDGVTDEEPIEAPTWYPDTDADSFGDPGLGVLACEAPKAHVALGTDCDDTNAAVNPAAMELCNGADDDCDATIDEDDSSDAPSWYLDLDTDGWGNLASSTRACSLPEGFAASAGDCDDENSAVHPEATEICNGVDDDCDGAADDSATDAPVWFYDGDLDGYGDLARRATSCTAPTSYVGTAGDCDDSEPTTSPDALESCDRVDNDCDSLIDEDDSIDAPTWYLDTDTDGHGTAASTRSACEAPTGFASASDDCDDTNPAIYPGADEIENALDDDCDGTIDESSPAVHRVCDTDGDFTSIQDAVDASSNGDTILICAGTWQENVVIDSVSVHIDGEGGPEQTIVDGGESGAFAIEGVEVEISNLSITGTSHQLIAAAISASSASLVLRDSIIRGARYEDGYAAVQLMETTAEVVRNVFEENVTDVILEASDGGGLTLRHNVFRNNSWWPYSADNTALLVQDVESEISNNLFYANLIGSSVVYLRSDETEFIWFYNNVIANNQAETSASSVRALYANGEFLEIQNNIIYGNSNLTGFECGTEDPLMEYNDSYANEVNYDSCSAGTNVQQDPRFVSASTRDYSLLSDSPCLNTGNSMSGYNDLDDTRNDKGIFGGAHGDWETERLTFYADTDVDGFGDPAQWTRAASAPLYHVDNLLDCDDTNASVHPGAGDPTDLLDNDCDGELDEGSTSAFNVCPYDAEFDTIQAAVDAATSGDTITLCAATYAENVSISSKTLTLVGESSAETIIDGGTGSALTLSSADLTLSGLSLTGFAQSANASAIYARSSSLLATDIRIVNGQSPITSATTYGLYLNAVSAEISDSIFQDNTTTYLVYANGHSDLTFAGNLFQDNNPNIATLAGALFLSTQTDVLFANNLFIGNYSLDASMIDFTPSPGKTQEAYNNVFYDNMATSIVSVTGAFFENNIMYMNHARAASVTGSTAVFLYNDEFGNGSSYRCTSCTLSATNLSRPPRFTDPTAHDFSLAPGFSPCVNTGDPSTSFNDLDGSRNDMGIFGGPFAGSW